MIATDLITILDAVVADGVGQSLDVSQHRFITVAVDTASNANLTLQAVGSIAYSCPTFSAAQTAANSYDFISMIDLQDASAVYGDDGIKPAGTDDHRLLTINVDGIKWLNFKVSDYVAGAVTVKIKKFKD